MIAYIPARGGSKRIPRKNIREIGGKPILGHVIENVKGLPFIEQVCVSTDDHEIADVALKYGAVIHDFRKAELSNDFAGFMDLIKDDVPRYLDAVEDKNNFLFILATAMLVAPDILKKAHQEFISSSAEVLMSVQAFDPHPYRALTVDENGNIKALYGEKIKMRTQDMPPMFVDAGCFYFFNRSAVIRNSGIWDCKVKPVLLDHSIGIDIDTEADWLRLEQALSSRKNIQ